MNNIIFKTLLLKGEAGNNIASIDKTATAGLVDTYTVTLTDGTTTTFEVTNGNGITSIEKTATSGLVDTYTVTLTNGGTTTFTVTNGKGISNVAKTATAGLVDTYTITYNDGTTSTFTVTNGKGITSIEKTATSGFIDTYTITYNDGTTSTFTVTNGGWVDNSEKSATTNFETITGGLIHSLKVQLNPVQSGSGDPSPSNVRPISGHTQAKILRAGINLFDKNGAQASYSGTTVTVDGETITVNGKYYGGITVELPAGTYTVSYRVLSSSERCGFRFHFEDGTNSDAYEYNETNVSKTVTVSKKINALYLYGGSELSGISVYKNVQIEKGSTATAFEPYKGEEVTVDLDGTRYGGVLDVISGVLTVTMEEVDLGSLNWDYQSSSTRFYVSSPSDLKMPSVNSSSINGMCSFYRLTAYEGYGDKDIAVTTTGSMFVKDSTYTDAPTFKTAVTGQKLVYELATPITVQLTPEEVTALTGINNVIATLDGQEIAEVNYRPVVIYEDIESKVDALESRVGTLESGLGALESRVGTLETNANKVTWSSSVNKLTGDTSATITDAKITTNSVIEVFSSNSSGTVIYAKTVVVTTGQAVITFDALTEATSFKLRITN